MIGYVIAFIVSMLLLLFVMHDSIFTKKEKQKKVEEEPILNEVEEEINQEHLELTQFLRKHVYKHATFHFKHLKDSKNGYYFEDGNFSMTIFEYPLYRTAQFFQVKPYKPLAVMRSTKANLQDIDIEYKDIPQETKASIRLFFEKVSNINLKNLHNTRTDSQIQDIHERIEQLIIRLEKEAILLSSELKHSIRRIKTIELPEIMDKYHSLQSYELETGKTNIKEMLEKVEQYLEEKWENLLEEKKREYERLLTTSATKK